MQVVRRTVVQVGRCAGGQVDRRGSVQVGRCAGGQVGRWASVQVDRCAGGQVCRWASVQVGRCAALSEMRRFKCTHFHDRMLIFSQRCCQVHGASNDANRGGQRFPGIWQRRFCAALLGEQFYALFCGFHCTCAALERSCCTAVWSSAVSIVPALL